MTDHSDSANLKSEIEEERQALADSLSQIVSDFSPDKIFKSVADSIGPVGKELPERISQAAKDNPLALGLVGAGLAWLAYSASRSDKGSASYDNRSRPAVSGLNDNFDMSEFDERLDRMNETSASNSGWGLGSLSDMRDRLYDGTSELSDLARERVVDARRKAIAVQERIEAAARRATRKTTEMAESNPIVPLIGLALAGAAAAYALPRTDTEDRWFGERRDELVGQANQVLREELDRAKRVGVAALEEAKARGQEALDSIPSGDEAVRKVEEQVKDVADAAAKRADETRPH